MRKDCTTNLLEWLISKNEDLYRKAINCLYQEMYHNIIGMIINKGGTREIAEEIYWDGILEVDRWAKLKKFQPDSNVPGFLKTVCLRIWLKMVERDHNTKYSQLPSNLEQLLKEKTVISELLLPDDLREILNALMDLIGEKCKEKVSLYYWRGFNHQEIADYLELSSASVVTVSMGRCLKKLRQILEDLGGMDLFNNDNV